MIPFRRAAPLRPIAATIAVVVHLDRVLLVRRANSPDSGFWGFPGGKVEFGETIETCAVRELQEETSILGRPVRVMTAVDAFDRYDDETQQHFVLVVVLCEWIAGHPQADDDALEARWFSYPELEHADLALSMDVARIAREARYLLKAV